MNVHFTQMDNGSILVEWVSAHVRFFINIEANPEESGWGFVNGYDKEKCAMGKLPPEFLRLLTLYAADLAVCPVCKEPYTGSGICVNCAGDVISPSR